jgi:hypothetical protein
MSYIVPIILLYRLPTAGPNKYNRMITINTNRIKIKAYSTRLCPRDLNICLIDSSYQHQVILPFLGMPDKTLSAFIQRLSIARDRLIHKRNIIIVESRCALMVGYL